MLEQSATSPYVGLVVDLSEQISAYGSVSKIFNPQTKTDASGAGGRGRAPAPEVGLKGEFLQRRLNTACRCLKCSRTILPSRPVMWAAGLLPWDLGQVRGVEFDVSGELATTGRPAWVWWHSRLPARTARMCACMCRAVRYGCPPPGACRSWSS
jgi:outer membrane receptor for ferric coprogen and ferric-rhodotorulic acid